MIIGRMVDGREKRVILAITSDKDGIRMLLPRDCYEVAMTRGDAMEFLDLLVKAIEKSDPEDA